MVFVVTVAAVTAAAVTDVADVVVVAAAAELLWVQESQLQGTRQEVVQLQTDLQACQAQLAQQRWIFERQHAEDKQQLASLSKSLQTSQRRAEQMMMERDYAQILRLEGLRNLEYAEEQLHQAQDRLQPLRNNVRSQKLL